MREVIGVTTEGIKILIDILRDHLKTPFQRPGKSSFREELIDKSAALFYLLVENHVLPTNGNKRLATHAMLFMLFVNRYSLEASEKQVYDLSIFVTQLAKDRKPHYKVIGKIKAFLRKHIRCVISLQDEAMKEIFKDFLSGKE